MKGKIWLTVLILGGLNLLSLDAVKGAEPPMQLRVNLRLSALDPGVAASVTCFVETRPLERIVTAAYPASGKARIPLRDGNYTGTVTVKVLFDERMMERQGKSRSEFRYYYCYLALQKGSEWGMARRSARHIWMRPKPKTKFTSELSGTLP
jgi:hypothetical protein